MVAIPTLLLVMVFVFILQRLLPGDPLLVMAGEERDPVVLEELRKLYGFDQPLPVQFLVWMREVLSGNFGVSLRTSIPVTQLIAQTLPVTIQLAVASIIIALLIGIPMGILAAVKKGTTVDYIASAVSLSGLSIPNFWLGIILILVVSVQMRWLPASGFVSVFDNPMEALRVTIMPAFVLGSGLAAALMRHTRSAMLEVLRLDYIRTARAKGVFERLVVTRHAMRNALLPAITVAGLEFAFLIGGLVVTEQVFNLNGIGRLFVEAVSRSDFILIQALVMLLALVFVTMNLVIDMLYGVLDPRVRHG